MSTCIGENLHLNGFLFLYRINNVNCDNNNNKKLLTKFK